MSRSTGSTVKAIHRRDRRCWLCGHPVSLAEASRDHVRPRFFTGYDKSSNYRLAHASCNSARGHLPASETIAVTKPLREAGATRAEVASALGAALRDWRREHQAHR